MYKDGPSLPPAAIRLLTAVRLPNQFLRSDPDPANTGNGGEPPFWGLLQAADLPIINRGGTKKYGRRVQEALQDHGTSFEWYRDPGSPLDDNAAFTNALTDPCLVIDSPSIYLDGSITSLTNVNVISLLGDLPVTIYQSDPTAQIFNFTGCYNARFWGKFRFAYLASPVAAERAVWFQDCRNIYFDDLTIEGAGTGVYVNDGSRDIRFGNLTILDAIGDAAILDDGHGFTVDNHLRIDGAGGRGLLFSSTWEGGFKANIVTVTGSQGVGIQYISAGALDQITDLRVSNNGLSASGTLAGLRIDAAARDLRVLGGEIGQDGEDSAATQLYGVTIASGADRIAIGANLIGNTNAYSNSSTDDVALTGCMPAGTLPVLSPPTLDAIAASLGFSSGNYVPTFSFATPGDLVFVATSAKAWWTRKPNDEVYVEGTIAGTPTFGGTASGNIQISLPFTAFTSSPAVQPIIAIGQPNSGFTWGTGFTELQGRTQNNSAFFLLSVAKSAGTSGLLTTASVVSGAAISFQFSGTFLAAP